MSTVATRLLLTLFAIAFAGAAEFPHQASDLVPDPGVRWGVLPNGVRWCALANSQPPGRASLRLRVGSGSFQETDAQRGLAHYLEHMAFNGTTHFPPGELNKRLQPLGIGFGSHSNAHTSFDETVYKLDLPDVKSETMDLGLTVLADFAGGMLLQAEEIEREKGIILAEMRDRDSPGFRTQQALFSAWFPGIRLAERFPIGIPETIREATPELVIDYYRSWYRPERMILAVVGDIDPQTIEPLLIRNFGPLADLAPRREDLGKGTLVVDPTKPTFAVHREAEAEGTELTLGAISVPDEGADSAARRRRWLIADLGGSILARRLAEQAEAAPDGPLISAGGGIGRWLDLRIVTFSGQIRAGRSREATEQLVREVRRFIAFGPTADELSAVKAEALAALDAGVQRAPNRTNAQLSGALYDSVAEGLVFMAPTTVRDMQRPWIEAVTAEEITASWAELWPVGHHCVTLAGKEVADDALATLAAASASAEAEALAAPASQQVAPWAYGERPAAVSAISREEPGHGVISLAWANGVRANLRPNAEKPGEVQIRVRLVLPSKESPPGVKELISRGFIAGGLTAHSQRDLRTVLAGTTAQVGGGVGDDAFQLNGGCLPRDIETCLQLIRAHLLDAGWRSDAERQVKDGWLEDLAALPTNLDALVRRRFLDVVVGGDPARRSATKDEAEAVSFDQARAWIAPVLASAPIVVSVVGDIDPEAVIALLDAYVGSLPERSPIRVVPDGTAEGALWPGVALRRETVRIEVPGTAARALIFVAWPTDDMYVIQRTRRLSLVADALGERLRDRLREALGQAYSPSCWHSPGSSFDGEGQLMIVVSVAPENTDVALAAIREEVALLAKEGIDEAMLAQIQPPALASLSTYVRQNGYWLNSVVDRCQEQPFRIAWATSLEEDLRSATAAEVSALAATYLVGEPLIVIGVCQGDQGQKAPAAP